MTTDRTERVRHRVDVRRAVRYHVETRGHDHHEPQGVRPRRRRRPSTTRAAGAAPGSSSAGCRAAASMTLVLAEASRVPGFSSVCSSMWSCRVGRFVIINQERWKHASPAWNAANGALRDYRHMVVNHETGHWLGLGHAGCPGPGPAGAGDDAAVQGAGAAATSTRGRPRASWPAAHQGPDGPWRTASRVVTLAVDRRVAEPTGSQALREIVVFSGSAHRPLATAICDGARRRAQLGRADPVQQRLPPGAAAGQLPPARRLHRAAAGAADAGAPDGAAADDRRGPRARRRRRSPR